VREEVYGYNRMGDVARSSVTSYEPARRACVAEEAAAASAAAVSGRPGGVLCRSERTSAVVGTGEKPSRRVYEGRAAAVVESEFAVYDVRSRRIGVVEQVDVLASGARPDQSLVSFALEAGAQDPFAESSQEASEVSPGSRWVVRDALGVVAETRQSVTRYVNADLQGSTMQLVDGMRDPAVGGRVRATFSYDSFGTMQRNDPTRSTADASAPFVSGTRREQAWSAYAYTGMRRASHSATTHHHARDYNPATRTWLQTDQYMDPWRDVALSLDPTTRDRHAYAGGNPVSFVDVDGHKRCSENCNSITGAQSEGKAPIAGTPADLSTRGGGDPAGSGGQVTGHAPPRKIVSATPLEEPKYSLGARLASNIDCFWGAVSPWDSCREAKQATLDASWECSTMRSFGNGFLGGSSCSTAYGSLVPIPGGPGVSSGAKSVAKGVTRGVARQGLDDAAAAGEAFSHWAPYARELPDGRVRSYAKLRPARSFGEMAGNRKVREINPVTGQRRVWMETYDYAGNVRIVSPKNGDEVHYLFDPMGVFSGTFIP
jgi:RHS repeat-associated protein